ncbi:Polyferredoxin protein MvhB [Candidatus Methanobinarius endosymbioticus]|uniref:Polyferredoxin protein MvhB n=1 Tax=Candidatus Methanobinarius endosymbioticus TaxID=2006182 RepID=A0A366MC24_9EURY|nr:Polyferredoxin protein MvhB [Candidatus Methanobinarius endosymbioticus]
MEMKLKKQMKNLQKEVVLKSVDLNDDIGDFEVNIGAYEVEDKFITISPRCVRCDLCVEECPVDAISHSNIVKRSRIQDNCVKCNICVQTCPISCIYAMGTTSAINEKYDDVEYQLKEIKVPHRVLRMENISIDRKKCEDCGNCIRFCPTNAITLKNKSIIEAADDTTYFELEDKDYPYIEKKLCVGCGSCANLCNNGGIILEKILGPVIVTKNLCIDQNACVQCYLCEETCPVDAIKLDGDKVVLDDDKCIRCNVCSSKCPVNALNLKNLSDIE